MACLLADWNEPPPTLQGYDMPHVIFDMRGWRGLMNPREMDDLSLVSDTSGFLIGVQIESHFLAYNHSWYMWSHTARRLRSL